MHVSTAASTKEANKFSLCNLASYYCRGRMDSLALHLVGGGTHCVPQDPVLLLQPCDLTLQLLKLSTEKRETPRAEWGSQPMRAFMELKNPYPN